MFSQIKEKEKDDRFWREFEDCRARIEAQFNNAMALLRDYQKKTCNVPENAATFEAITNHVTSSPPDPSSLDRILVSHWLSELIANIESTKTEFDKITRQRAEKLSDGMCSARSWADKAITQATRFAGALVETVDTVTKSEKSTDTPLRLQQLQDAAKGSLIPPKVKAAMKSMIPSFLFLGGLSLLWGLTGAGAAIMATGPVGIALVGTAALVFAVVLAVVVYNAGNSAERAQAETDQRDERIKLASHVTRLFSPKKQVVELDPDNNNDNIGFAMGAQLQ